MQEATPRDPRGSYPFLYLCWMQLLLSTSNGTLSKWHLTTVVVVVEKYSSSDTPFNSESFVHATIRHNISLSHQYFPNASSMTILSISNKTSKANSMAFTTFSSLDCLLDSVSNSHIPFINHGASSLLSHVPQPFTNMYGYSYHSTNNQYLYDIN
jgi:hypothetical protein